MFSQIFKHLENRGYHVFAVGQHKGLCLTPYVVVKSRGERPFLTGLTIELVEFILFYPFEHFSEVEEYLGKMKEVLGDLAALKDTFVITPTVIDQQVRAYTTTVTYQIVKKRRCAHG